MKGRVLSVLALGAGLLSSLLSAAPIAAADAEPVFLSPERGSGVPASASGPQHPTHGGPDGVHRDLRTLDNLSSEQSIPPPVADQEKFSFLLFDRFEYTPDGLHWDILSWQGGDVHRWWFKSEGDQSVRGYGGEADLQLLRGRLISPFLDLQYGLRFQGKWGDGAQGRAFAVIGLQGLAPYRYEIEPALFISQEGDVSARFTATYDWFLTQRLVLQPRLETNLAVQRVERFDVGSGLNDLELALLLRYEIRKEFAPYIGLSWKNSFGDTARFIRRGGQDPNRLLLVFGIRAWF